MATLTSDAVAGGELTRAPLGLVPSLLRPDAYPESERPERVELIETHISWLFLTGRFVYKVKKPVNYGFLDFTTLDQRRFFCHEEVRLNRRLSPDVYLGVVEIAERDGRYLIDGPGHPADYAVKMRQLPRHQWLSQLLRQNQASPALMRRIARRIADFHQGAATSADIRRIGGIETVHVNTEENFQQTVEYVDVTLTREAYDRVRAYTEAFLEARASVFDQRARSDRIRDCHGDLHADQICAENGITFIDCIEFNPRFRYGDVAADIAFTAMDVEYYGQPELSRVLTEEYVAASDDLGVWEVLDFYHCYRAYTRGKVRSFRLRQPGLSQDERGAITQQASRYFQLAAEYARLKGPLLLVTCGLMGTGKTTLARALGARLGAQVLSSDLVRKELAGLRPEEPQREPWGAGIYGEAFNDQTYQELHGRAAEQLRKGEVVIVDASYRDAARRDRARETARSLSAPFLLLETRCRRGVLEERLVARRSGPSDGRLELLDAQQARFQAPTEVPIAERITLDMAGELDRTVASALSEVYRRRLAAT